MRDGSEGRDEEPREGAFAGSLLYAAPEQFSGKEVGPRADLYSVGVMLYEMLTGRRPFHHADVESLMVAHAREVPPRGGDTLFASTYAAYEDLPEADKQRFEGLQVVHAMQAGLFPAMRDCTPEQFAVWSSYPRRTYPLVWHHNSGRKSLVLSTSAAWIEGMHPAASHDLLEELMRYATQERYIYRHKWQMGDLVIWDNTGAMHRVIPYDESSGRMMHRTSLAGTESVAA